MQLNLIHTRSGLTESRKKEKAWRKKPAFVLFVLFCFCFTLNCIDLVYNVHIIVDTGQCTLGRGGGTGCFSKVRIKEVELAKVNFFAVFL